MQAKKENITYLADVIPHVRNKFPSKQSIKMFGYHNAFKLITLSTILMVGWAVSTIVNL